MKGFPKLLIIALVLIIGLFTTACENNSKLPPGDTTLSIPANVSISVTGRIMTVTWDAADNAFGYEIVTTSEGCESGNRTINTKENTAVVTSGGAVATNVTIGEGTSITITLTAYSSENPNIPMANAVTAKVKSIGGTVSGKKYIDSDYSETENKPIEHGKINLSIPKNVSIVITGRIMTVTWDAADNALGYEIVTTSEGCGSGDRTINTKEKTAVVTGGAAATNVTIGEGTLITITLMASGDPNIPMASAVTAKAKSIGGTVSGKEYVDSPYSETVNKTIEK
jgi:hypothetical protein